MISVLVAVITIYPGSSDAAPQGDASSEPGQAVTSEDSSPGVPAEGAPGEAGDDEKFAIDVGAALESRRTGSPQASAAIITTADTQTLVERGQFTLRRYLRMVPGFDDIGGFGVSWPAARGVAGSVNMMIDGVSITSPVDYRYPAGPGLFLEEFDRVEVISGPAGVPWGAHSLLGVVNLITGRASTEGTTVRVALGAHDLQRVTSRTDVKLGDGTLRLSAGYASQRPARDEPETRFDGVPPYSDTWYLSDAEGKTTPAPDLYLSLSARYVAPKLVAYLRLPMTREHYQLSEFGGVLQQNNDGRRESVNGMAFISYQDSFLDGRMALISRLSWYLIAERLDRQLFPPSDSLRDGARAVQEIMMSRTTAVIESSWRLQTALLRSDLMAGVEGAIEVPHDSRFLATDPALGGATVEYSSPVVRSRTGTTASAYLFDEVRLFDQLSVAGGARYNVADSYQPVTLYQASTGLRLLGESYVKFSFTQGIRPPRLLDREGIRPVLGSHKLEPETSRAFQFEVNGSVENVMMTDRLYGRIDYIATNTDNGINCEGLLMAQYLCRPTSTTSKQIQTIEGVIETDLSTDSSVSAMYRWNVVREPGADKLRPDDFATAPNHGPRHLWRVDVDNSLLSWAAVHLAYTGRCGGDWQVLRERGPDLAARPKSERESMGCYHFIDTAVRLTTRDLPVAITLSVENMLDARPPIAMFSFPELGLAEPPNRSSYARTAFAMVEWSPERNVAW